MAAQSMAITLEEAGLREVVLRAQQGRRDAFSVLYESHHRYVLWICRRYFWRPEDAEDAAAEIFLKLHGVLGSHDPSMPFRPWLAQVSVRHCIDKLRRREREQRHCIEGEEIAAVADMASPSPLAQVLRAENDRQVREVLQRLPEHYRMPLFLRYYSQMSYTEIARTMGRSLPVVRMILFRAKKELRERLKQASRAKRESRMLGKHGVSQPFVSAISEACAAD